jgi:hypothetical protein
MSKQALLREAERNAEQKDELQQSAEGKVRHAFLQSIYRVWR